MDTIDTFGDIRQKSGHGTYGQLARAFGRRMTLLADTHLHSGLDTAEAVALLKDAFSGIDFGVLLLDDDLRCVMCNDQYMQDMARYRPSLFPIGVKGEEIIAEIYHSGTLIILPEGATETQIVDYYMNWARTCPGPEDIYMADGRFIVMNAKKTALGGVLITTRDVTAERDIDTKARGMLFDAIESLEEGFALYDEDLCFVTCNQNYVDMALFYRNSPYEVGTTLAQGARESFRAGVVELPEGVTEDLMAEDIVAWISGTGEPREFSFKNGRVIRMTARKTALGGYMVTVVDLTKERNSAEKAQDMLLDAFQALDEGLVLCDENMNFVFGNDAWIKMNFEGVEHMIPKPGDSVVENVAKLVEMGHYAVPEGMTNEAYLEWVMGEMSQHGKRAHLQFANGRHIMGSSHLTSYGGALLFVRDITEQQKLEEELAEQREIAHQTEKLSALGELLAGVAHELNNPLSVVFGYSQMLQGKIQDPVLSERVDLICQSSERAAKIVRTFLAMARQRPTRMAQCAVNEIVETALEVSSYSLKSNGTEVVVDFDTADPQVIGDMDQLAQVFSNLIVNAGHAVASKGASGKLTVRTFTKNGTVQVAVTDNGNGIPDHIQSRIFEPFFTTKDVGEGTGIGLAFSHRIVESHDGTLTVSSKVGKGTTFYVKLQAAADVESAQAAEPAPVTERLSVLVVDDEAGVARLISDLLTEAGFRVTVSTDPRAALKLAETTRFDAVLSDFKMPQMNGETFFRAMEAVAPDNAQRVGFITGDAMSAHVAKFFATSGRPHIEKPIIMAELLDLLKIVTEGTDT